MTLRELASRYLVLRSQKEMLEAQLSEINKEFDQIRLQDIPSEMESEGVKSITLEGLGRVGLTADLYISCPAEKKPELYDWFRANGYSPLVVDYIHPSTLKAWAKERLLQAQALPEIVTVTPFMRASVTKIS
mgnify:CR=1 FL=1